MKETVICTGGGTASVVGWAVLNQLPLVNIIGSAVIGTIISFFIMEGLKWLKQKFINKKSNNGKIN